MAKIANQQFLEESVYRFTYDTSVDTTTLGTHVLGSLPDNYVITQAWIHVLTTFSGDVDDSATIALGYTGVTAAFDAATAISVGTTWDAAIPRVSDNAADGAVGNFITAAAGDQILLTSAIGAGASTALATGKLILIVKGYRAI